MTRNFSSHKKDSSHTDGGNKNKGNAGDRIIARTTKCVM